MIFLLASAFFFYQNRLYWRTAPGDSRGGESPYAGSVHSKKKMPEFHRNVQEMTECLEILRKSARKFGKCWKCPEVDFVGSFIFRFIFSFVSLKSSGLQ